MNRKYLIAIIFLTPIAISLFTPQVFPLENEHKKKSGPDVDTLDAGQFVFEDDLYDGGYGVQFYNGTKYEPQHIKAIIEIRWPTRDTFQTDVRWMECKGGGHQMVKCVSNKGGPGGSVIRADTEKWEIYVKSP